MLTENGRTLHIMAGYRYIGGSKMYMTSEVNNVFLKHDTKSGLLFNVIEEVEEECIETP